MSERTKLLKKAVLAGVGATGNPDRIKAALNDAMQDLVKVGRDLIDELEGKGKAKSDSVQSFLRNLQEEASRKTYDAEKKVASRVQGSTKRAVKEFGLATREDIEEIFDRLATIEEHLNITHENGGASEDEGEPQEGKKRSRKKSQSSSNN